MRIVSAIFLFFFCGCEVLHASNHSQLPAFQGSPSQIVDAVIKKLGPVRNQRDTQMCFGNAVADIATFYSGQRVSAFSTAVRYFQKRNGIDYLLFNPGGVIASQVGGDSRYMLGLASSALDSIRQSTLCVDDQPENDLTYRDADLKQLWDLYHRQFRSYIGPTAPVELYEKIQVQLSQLAPSLDASDFIKGISRYKPLDFALGDWFDRNCKIRIKGLKKVIGEETTLMSATQIINYLEMSLAAGELAVIHYDPGVLDAKAPSFWQSAIGFHISVIVAKADMQNGRHYLLRNSWGSDCSIYSSEIASRCDRGHIWLTEDEVRSYVTSVSYLKDSN